MFIPYQLSEEAVDLGAHNSLVKLTVIPHSPVFSATPINLLNPEKEVIATDPFSHMTNAPYHVHFIYLFGKAINLFYGGISFCL